MRIVKFTKIDVIRSKSYLYFLLFPALAAVMMIYNSHANPFFGTMYCLFGGIVLSSIPFTQSLSSNSDFLRMLPAKNGDEIRGHFLFSLAVLLLNLGMALISVAVAIPFRPGLSFGPSYAYLLMFGIALLFVSIQGIVLCIFRTNNAHAIQLLRMAPAFLFFFGGSFLMEKLPGLYTVLPRYLNDRSALLFLSLCLLIFLINAHTAALLYSRQNG